MEDFIEYLANMITAYEDGIATKKELRDAVDNAHERLHEKKENHKEVEMLCSCRWCRKCASIWVNEDDFWEFEEGELVQKAFPYLTAGEREMILGMCEECSKKMFPDEEEEEEDFADSINMLLQNPEKYGLHLDLKGLDNSPKKVLTF